MHKYGPRYGVTLRALKLTSGAAYKHLERGQDGAVEWPGKACYGAGTGPLQGEAQPVVSVLQDSNCAR